MFDQLEEINSRPDPFAVYKAAGLWTDDHTSKQMLAYHLNADIDVSSRRGEFMDQSVAWMGSYFNIGTGTRIADLGCGPGLCANRLAKLGATVTGIDFSARSIEYVRAEAEKEGVSARYVNQNYLNFNTDVGNRTSSN